MKFITIENYILDISQILMIKVSEEKIDIYMKCKFTNWDEPFASITRKSPVKVALSPYLNVETDGIRYLIPFENVFAITKEEGVVFINFLPTYNCYGEKFYPVHGFGKCDSSDLYQSFKCYFDDKILTENYQTTTL